MEAKQHTAVVGGGVSTKHILHIIVYTISRISSLLCLAVRQPEAWYHSLQSHQPLPHKNNKFILQDVEAAAAVSLDLNECVEHKQSEPIEGWWL